MPWLSFLLLAAAIWGQPAAGAAAAAAVRLAWDAVVDARVAVYQLHVGTASGRYDRRLTTPATAIDVADLAPGVRHFFAVRACTAGGSLCSGFSDEISAVVEEARVAAPPRAAFSYSVSRSRTGPRSWPGSRPPTAVIRPPCAGATGCRTA